MRVILLAATALALSACGQSRTEGDEANVAAGNAAGNMTVDQNLTMDQNMAMDQNMSMNAATDMGGNAAGDANAQNMMMKDANTNDPDTNLANGL